MKNFYFVLFVQNKNWGVALKMYAILFPLSQLCWAFGLCVSWLGDLCLALRLSVIFGNYIISRLLTSLLTLILASQYVVQNHTGKDHFPHCFWG